MDSLFWQQCQSPRILLILVVPPPIEFSKASNTNDVAAETGSQKSNDSEKVYDFKDSKTSGVVTVTKSWDDNMSNDERPVPDVSISTENQAKIHWVIPLLIMEMGLLSQMETQKMKSL